MKEIELLAPAGSFEKAKTAFLYGADAIYCGTDDLSLRARADMNLESLEETIKFAHSIGKKVYVTVNIFATDNMYEKIEHMARKLEEIRPDGVIISDPGVFNLFKKLTTLDLHISTQANIVSSYDAKFWKEQGASRVILARELTFQQIENIVKQNPELEVEMFIHGAICFSYSGRCFLSDFMSCRSANQGDCSQSCRWSYNIYLEEKNNPGNLMIVESEKNGTTILSSKDLCLIQEMGKILESGVKSLKIEGRLKTQYYIASVVNVYRCFIDEYIKLKKENKQDTIDVGKYITELEKVKTREYTTLFFNGKQNKDIFDHNGKQYNENFENAGIVLEKILDNTYVIEIKNKLNLQDKLEVLIPYVLEPKKFTIQSLYDYDSYMEKGNLEKIEYVSPGIKGQKVIIEIPDNMLKEGYILRKEK